MRNRPSAPATADCCHLPTPSGQSSAFPDTPVEIRAAHGDSGRPQEGIRLCRNSRSFAARFTFGWMFPTQISCEANFFSPRDARNGMRPITVRPLNSRASSAFPDTPRDPLRVTATIWGVRKNGSAPWRTDARSTRSSRDHATTRLRIAVSKERGATVSQTRLPSCRRVSVVLNYDMGFWASPVGGLYQFMAVTAWIQQTNLFRERLAPVLIHNVRSRVRASGERKPGTGRPLVDACRKNGRLPLRSP